MALQENPPLRVLVIGAGPATRLMHLPALAQLRDRGDIELVMVCDIQRERAAAARASFGFLEEGGEGLVALERADIDAVYLFGSAQLHYECGLAALRNGKHLFVEKPIAPSFAQARELQHTAAACGVIAAGGHNRRFYKSLDAVRARAGGVRWRYAEAIFHKPEFGKAPQFGARTWLSSNGIHALDALLFVMGGLPAQITAIASGASAPQPGAFSALMRWPDGAQAIFLCNNEAGSRREEYVFHGLGETCTVTADGLTTEKAGIVQRMPWPSVGDGIAAEHVAFLAAIRAGVEPPHGIGFLAPSLFLAELIEQGFSGPVQLPHEDAGGIPARKAGEAAVLVVRPAGLQGAIANFLPRRRLVSLEEVLNSPGPRPDVEAAILGQGAAALPAQALAKMPGLRVVGIAGLSFSRHEPQALVARGIALLNASSAHAQSVAEFAMGLAILGRRRAFLSHEVMRRGGWGVSAGASRFESLLRGVARGVRPVLRALRLESQFLAVWRSAKSGGLAGAGAGGNLARDLRNSTAGLIGWGVNASAFATRLIHAGARVLVYSERATPAEIRESGAIPVSLAEALAAEVVSLHRGLTQETRHCLGAAELDRLRPGAVLINVARGALIEPDALLARLRRGDIFACLDTYEEEPLSAASPLRRLPNVFLTAHIAGGSADMHAAAADEVVRKVARYLEGDAMEAMQVERLSKMT